MRILLRHLRIRLQLPTNRANYLLARCLCPLIRSLPGTRFLLMCQDLMIPGHLLTPKRPITLPELDMMLRSRDILRAGAIKSR
jgi:hypothetical protein